MSKNKKKKFLPKIVCIVLMSFVCLSGCGEKQEASILLQEELMTSEQANYKTVQVSTGEYEKEISGKATIVYLLRNNLYWENGNATFQECLVKRGQEVKKGDALMRFDSEKNRLELETLQLQLLRTKENFEKENTEKYAQLHAAKVRAQDLKEYDLQIAELNIEKQQAAYEQFLYESDRNMRRMEEQIAEIKAEAEQDVLTAPFDGIVEEIVNLSEGDQVMNGQWLVQMYSTDRMLLKAENATGKLRYNMDVMIENGKNDNLKSYSGKVIAAPHILPSSVSADITLIELKEDITQEQLKGNIKYRGISEEIQNILQVERKAIHREDKEEYVYVLEGDMVQKRYVKTTLSPADKVWILDGLYEGQTLIVD